MIKQLQKAHKKLLQLESFLLVSTFITTLLIAVIQIVLRNTLDTGIVWADTFLRISVLWLGMMGALVASRNNSHISMNLGQKYLSKKKLVIIKIIIYLFTAAVCFIVSWYGINLLQMEYEEGGLAFANVPIWCTVSIIPIAFMIIALRYLTLSLLLLSGQPVNDSPTAQAVTK